MNYSYCKDCYRMAKRSADGNCVECIAERKRAEQAEINRLGSMAVLDQLKKSHADSGDSQK